MAPDGTVTYFNEFAEDFFGFRADEIIGRHVVGTIVPEQESGSGRDLSAMIKALLADPKHFEDNENENVTRDGRRVTVRWANRVILDEQGQPTGVLSIGRDISEQRRLQEALRQKMAELTAIVDNSSVGITLVHERRWVWVNKRMCELFGYTAQELQGNGTRVVYPDQETYETLGREAYPCLIDGGLAVREQRMLHKDGHTFWARISGKAINPAVPNEGSIWIFEDIDDLLIDDNLDVLKLWFSWVLTRSYAPYLSSAFVDERFSFYGQKLTGQPINRPRWKRGVGLVEGSVGEAIGQLYVTKHFPPAAKAQMDELVSYLIKAYEQSIKALDWMSEETKVKALEKLAKFTPKIGYPSKWKDYSSIEISRDDLVTNVANVSGWEFDYHADKIGAPIDREEWHMTPQTVNAYYNPGLNEIVFPAAILQPPFFSPEADPAINFGGIGAVIGHEIGHGFDDQGSKYDGDGKLVSWWTEADREAFEKRTGSLIAQYSALSPTQLDDSYKVNGELTIGENIGDLGGLSIAWKAYLLFMDGKELPVIDGYTAAQRFLMSWAQCWRGISRDEIAIQRLATDPHSPAEFRCNQVVKNIDIYYEAFGVSEADEMYLAPKDRVVIW
jgi:PAS domain S-box-containing protein